MFSNQINRFFSIRMLQPGLKELTNMPNILKQQLLRTQPQIKKNHKQFQIKRGN